MHAEQEMARQGRGGAGSQYGVPTGPKRSDVEITQARNLDVECLLVWLEPDRSLRAAWRLGRPALGLAVHLLRLEPQPEALAHHACKETAHRVLLPASCLHHRRNRCPSGDRSIAMTRDCFEPGSAFLLSESA